MENKITKQEFNLPKISKEEFMQYIDNALENRSLFVESVGRNSGIMSIQNYTVKHSFCLEVIDNEPKSFKQFNETYFMFVPMNISENTLKAVYEKCMGKVNELSYIPIISPQDLLYSCLCDIKIKAKQSSYKTHLHR